MNTIEIVMEHPNKAPSIKLNGQVIKGVINLRYNYDTKTCDSQGQHNFTVEYCDKETETIRKVSIDKLIEVGKPSVNQVKIERPGLVFAKG